MVHLTQCSSCGTKIPSGGSGYCNNCAHEKAQKNQREVKKQKNKIPTNKSVFCPSCGTIMSQSGMCKKCFNCGHTEGCS